MPTSTKFRGPVRFLAAATCAALLAGCGSSGGGDDAAAGADTVTTEDMTPAAAMQKVAESAKSVESTAYTFEMSGGGLSMKGHGAYRTKPELAMQMIFDSMSLGGAGGGLGGLGSLGGMEQRIIGDELYMRGGMFGMLGGADKWLKVDLGEAGGASGLDLKSMLTQSTQADPVQQLQSLLAAGDVKSVGTETIDGVKTTHYTGELDAGDLSKASQLDAEVREQLEKAYESARMGATHLDVWVDESFQPRRFMSSSTTPMGDVKMTMNFTDYGKSVDIAVPSQDEVTDMSSLARLGAGMADSTPKSS